MRVYLEVGQTVPKEKGGNTLYRGGAFFEVDNTLGQRWLDEGVAKKATKKNEIIEDAPKKPIPAPEKKPIAPPPPVMGRIEDANDGDKPSGK